MTDPLEEIIVRQRVTAAANLVAGRQKLFVSEVFQPSKGDSIWTIRFTGASRNYQVSIEARADDKGDGIGDKIENGLTLEMAKSAS
ncbi:MAG TPA: hypothetical protein VKH81_13310 [Candidatus Angelobacter sp.]|nr:hypothetical protein [Candidatus Angelobacter sp.]